MGRFEGRFAGSRWGTVSGGWQAHKSLGSLWVAHSCGFCKGGAFDFAYFFCITRRLPTPRISFFQVACFDFSIHFPTPATAICD